MSYPFKDIYFEKAMFDKAATQKNQFRNSLQTYIVSKLRDFVLQRGKRALTDRSVLFGTRLEGKAMFDKAATQKNQLRNSLQTYSVSKLSDFVLQRGKRALTDRSVLFGTRLEGKAMFDKAATQKNQFHNSLQTYSVSKLRDFVLQRGKRALTDRSVLFGTRLEGKAMFDKAATQKNQFAP